MAVKIPAVVITAKDATARAFGSVNKGLKKSDGLPVPSLKGSPVRPLPGRLPVSPLWGRWLPRR